MLYLDVRRDEGCEQLYRLAAAARTAYQEAGLPLQGEGREFAPHLTVAKMSKLLEAAGGGRGRPWRRGRRGGGRGGRWREGGGAAEPGAGPAPAGGERAGGGEELGAGHRAEEDAGAAMETEKSASAAAVRPGRSIPPEAWAAQAGVSGGAALVAEVQLCSMHTPRKPGGYYAVAASLALG